MGLPPLNESLQQSDVPLDVEFAPYSILAPLKQRAPLVFSSPHSGRAYPPDFLALTRLQPAAMRRSEDAFIDDVFGAAPELGAPLLRAHFPRAYVDVNREAYELDPTMFADPLPPHANTTSPRVAAGLGTIPRVVATGEEIYGRPLSLADAERRIENYYIPYHEALKGLIDRTVARFGCCLLVDCHSMPSIGGPMDTDSGLKRLDAVLGDCHGSSCAPFVTDTAERAMAALGFRVARNNPYAGGFTTRHYGRPQRGTHALQIEFNRVLYMDEIKIEPKSGLDELKSRVRRLIEALMAMDTRRLLPL
ncbi:MAG: N-formylglutamate amidohydrolase [Rhodospirillales bacterium]|nr:N-formylglutamate amidohydrolase [Rhodospirillales bacterium]